MRRLNITLLGLYRYFLRKDPDKHVALFYAQTAMSTALMVFVLSLLFLLWQLTSWGLLDPSRYSDLPFAVTIAVGCYIVVFFMTKKTAALEAMEEDEEVVDQAMIVFWFLYVGIFIVAMTLAAVFHHAT